VPVAITVDECWQLVRTSEATGKPCMMLENVCYFRSAMAILNMIRQGVFGELTHAAGGYQHDVRYRWIIDGKMTWRGKYSATRNGCLYPTHQAGPISQWLNINHGDRFTQIISMSTKSMGINNYAAEKCGPDDPLAKMTWALGDTNTTLLKTANGRTVTLYHDCSNYRPYDLMFRLQGTKGIYYQTYEKIYIHGAAPGKEKFEDFTPYLEEFDDPMWKRNEAEAKSSGHGGADYMTLLAFIEAARNGTPTPIDVYDSVTWAAIHPLSCESVSKGSMPVEFPDFTSGRWQTAAPRRRGGGG
jgi:predicted dehydrogenase